MKRVASSRCSGAAHGAAIGAAPGVQAATGPTRTLGAASSGFVAPGLKVNLFSFTLLTQITG